MHMHGDISDYLCVYVNSPINIIMYKCIPNYNMHGDHITSDVSYLIAEHINIHCDNSIYVLVTMHVNMHYYNHSYFFITMHTNLHYDNHILTCILDM